MILIFLGILCAGILGIIVYFFLSPRSSRLLKRFALGALILSVLSLAGCLFLLLSTVGPVSRFYRTLLPLPPEAAPQPIRATDTTGLLIAVAVLLLLLAVIIFIGLRGQTRPDKEK